MSEMSDYGGSTAPPDKWNIEQIDVLGRWAVVDDQILSALRTRVVIHGWDHLTMEQGIQLLQILENCGILIDSHLRLKNAETEDFVPKEILNIKPYTPNINEEASKGKMKDLQDYMDKMKNLKITPWRIIPPKVTL